MTDSVRLNYDQQNSLTITQGDRIRRNHYRTTIEIVNVQTDQPGEEQDQECCKPLVCKTDIAVRMHKAFHPLS